MGKNIRKYEPTAEEVPDQCNLTDFEFILVQVEISNPKGKDFSSKYKVNLPAHIRSRNLATTTSYSACGTSQHNSWDCVLLFLI